MKNFSTSKIYLLILLFLLNSGIVRSQSGIPDNFLKEKSELVYDASFQYKDKQVSGLLIAKNELDYVHIVLLSKMGPTLMELQLGNNDIKWLKTISLMDKNYIKKNIGKDLRALFLTPLINPKKVKELRNGQYKVKKQINIKIQTKKNRVECASTIGFLNLFKTYVNFNYQDLDVIPDRINLKHRNLNLKIDLKKLKHD